MKLKDEYIKLPKEIVYDTYCKIVYEVKDYDDIARSKMLDDIIKEYKQKNFLYHICTGKELDFLEYVMNNELTKESLEKYAWEIKELNEKCIFSKVTLEVFEEQKENVNEALELYQNNKNEKKKIDDIIAFMVSIVRINGNMLKKAYMSMLKSFSGDSEENIHRLLGSPLFHFYCDFDYWWFESAQREEEFVFYRDYWDILNELDEARKTYGIAGKLEIDYRDNFDIFYYGFPIRNSKVKKMYDEVNKLPEKEVIFKIIDEARVLNNRFGLDIVVGQELMEIIEEALEETPCAAMNGFTPKNYEKELQLKDELDFKFPNVPQNNAHLCRKDADLFYKLYFALLDYANKKYDINPKLKKIYKQEELKPEDLYDINNKLWEEKDTIIPEFVDKNTNHFNDEELEIIKGWKNSVTSDKFIIVGFQREYTEVLSEDGKIYMVKGIRTDFDDIMKRFTLPLIVNMTLLMFKDKIVFNGFLTSTNISFGNDVKEAILKDYKSAMHYYHL